MTSEIGIFPIVLYTLLAIWLTAITYYLYKTIHHYNSLVKIGDRKTLTTILEQLIFHAKSNNVKIKQLDARMENQEIKSDLQVQKMGLLRYNPFADTGGEQSFVVSLLDNNNSGMILTSLQGRSGTRWYAKQVRKGKGVEFELSKEEEEAVHKAKKLT